MDIKKTFNVFIIGILTILAVIPFFRTGPKATIATEEQVIQSQVVSTPSVSTSSLDLVEEKNMKREVDIQASKPIILEGTKIINPPQNTPSVLEIIQPTNVVIPSVQKLSISDLSVVPGERSVNVYWKTNLNSESKVLLNGNAFFSKNGVGQTHSVEINNLEPNQSYTMTITALVNNDWTSQEYVFKTKIVPLIITLGSQSCLTNSCQISWQTNYVSNSSITITKVDQTDVSWFYESENNNSMSHTKRLNLSSNKQYFYKIRAMSNTESVEIEGSFTAILKENHCGSSYCP